MIQPWFKRSRNIAIFHGPAGWPQGYEERRYKECLLCGCEQQLRDVVFSTLFDLFRAIISWSFFFNSTCLDGSGWHPSKHYATKSQSMVQTFEFSIVFHSSFFSSQGRRMCAAHRTASFLRQSHHLGGHGQLSVARGGCWSEPGWGTAQDTLWLFNIAMEHSIFIDVFPIKTSISKGFSMAMLVITRWYHHYHPSVGWLGARSLSALGIWNRSVGAWWMDGGPFHCWSKLPHPSQLWGGLVREEL